MRKGQWFSSKRTRRPKEVSKGRRCSAKRAKARCIQTSSREGQKSSARVGGVQTIAQRPDAFRQAQAKAKGLHISAQRPVEFRQAHAKARGVQQRSEVIKYVSAQRLEEFR